MEDTAFEHKAKTIVIITFIDKLQIAINAIKEKYGGARKKNIKRFS